MNKQFGKELEVIINKIVLGARKEQGFYSSLLQQQPETLTKEDGKEAILSLFKEMVPKKRCSVTGDVEEGYFCDGFYACRQELLERIGGE
jgi:hypothetical protein